MDCKIEVVQGPRGLYRMAVTEAGLLSLSLPGVPAKRFRALVKDLLEKYPARGVAANADSVAANSKRFRALVSGWGSETAWHCFHFPPPLDLRGSPFRLLVWRTLRRLQPGCTESYGDLALRAGSERAARAVGTAMSCNPVALFVPCHRVVAGNGPGGFGTAGLRLKEYLLALEGGELRRGGSRGVAERK